MNCSYFNLILAVSVLLTLEISEKLKSYTPPKICESACCLLVTNQDELLVLKWHESVFIYIVFVTCLA